MTTDRRAWIGAGLPDGAYDALARELPASRVWSVLLDVMEARAAARPTAALVEQWQRDRFVVPALVDQRTTMAVDRELLDAAAAFEAIELSPVAPLGVCSGMGRASQNKVLSALRGTEVVADPTNVMALESARRLRVDPAAVVRLATSHRCVRAQEVRKLPGFSQHFRMFCLTSAGFERPHHAFLVDAIAEQAAVLGDAMDRLERRGFVFRDRKVTLLMSPDKTELGDRIAARMSPSPLARAVLDHRYYDGVRFQISARSIEDIEILLADGGAFDWLARLTSNRRAVFVASGIGSQLLPLLFQPRTQSGVTT
jgi:hypothetical protein